MLLEKEQEKIESRNKSFTYVALGSYSAHILTNSSKWWAPKMDESLVK